MTSKVDVDVSLPKTANSPSDLGYLDFFRPVPESLARHKVRAKYIPQPDGSLRLVSIQASTLPVFLPSGFEVRKSDKRDFDWNFDKVDASTADQKENVKRASRRAKIRAMDFILCNPDLDAFTTFTFDPKGTNRENWEDVYQRKLRGWLSNRVQRQGLKYIVVPEYHKDGNAIHFHAVMNAAALDLIEARYADSGRLVKKRRAGEVKQLYNLQDWPKGWSTVELVTGQGSTDKVAKYIFKYMGKQLGQRIGGRYFLHGGQLASPVYRYGEEIDQFLSPDLTETNRFSVDVTDNITYTEVSFL